MTTAGVYLKTTFKPLSGTAKPLSRVRSAAIAKITDQAVLTKLAATDKDWLVRYSAAKLLTDQSALPKVANGDENPSVRTAAAEKLAWLQKNAR
jgi:hypothetical protein